MNVSCRVPSVLALALFLLGTGCHSRHILVTVVNRTGRTIRLLEVDYPSASFGADRLDAGATLPNRLQLRGSGSLKVQYTAGDGHPVQIVGPELAERQEGGSRSSCCLRARPSFIQS